MTRIARIAVTVMLAAAGTANALSSTSGANQDRCWDSATNQVRDMNTTIGTSTGTGSTSSTTSSVGIGSGSASGGTGSSSGAGGSASGSSMGSGSSTGSNAQTRPTGMQDCP